MLFCYFLFYFLIIKYILLKGNGLYFAISLKVLTLGGKLPTSSSSLLGENVYKLYIEFLCYAS